MGIESSLRDLAAAENCQYEARAPHYRIGCVTYLEKRSGHWRLSVLYGPPLEKVRTGDPQRIMDRALWYVREIERGLKRIGPFGETLIEVAKRCSESGRTYRLDANLLLLTLTDGSPVRRRLACGASARRSPGVRRFELGFMLTSFARKVKEGAVVGVADLRYEWASQIDTSDHATHSEIPDPPKAQPRELADAGPLRHVVVTLR